MVHDTRRRFKRVKEYCDVRALKKHHRWQPGLEPKKLYIDFNTLYELFEYGIDCHHDATANIVDFLPSSQQAAIWGCFDSDTDLCRTTRPSCFLVLLDSGQDVDFPI